jgi:GT2 family glycosyltransferase
MPIELLVVDNGSTDDTIPMLQELGIRFLRNPENLGLTKGWNLGIEFMFSAMGARKILVLNNDVILPCNYLSFLLSTNEEMVTGTCWNIEDREKFMAIGPSFDAPSFDPNSRILGAFNYGAFLISERTWRTVGKMEERMFNYVQDIDYELRMILLGWRRVITGLQYCHLGSHCLKDASTEEYKWMAGRGDLDREVFATKWGFAINSPEHQKFKERQA